MSVTVEGLEEVQAKMRQVTRDVRGEPMVAAMKKACYLVESAAKANAPVDTGRLRSSITHGVTEDPLMGVVGSNVFYAPYMEMGTGIPAGRKRHWPPSSGLEVWARQHGFESGFVAARAIGMRGGLEPRRYLRKALEESIGKIRAFFDRAMKEVAEK